MVLAAQGVAHYRVVVFATSGEALERYKLAQDGAVNAGTIGQSMGTEIQVFESLLVSVAFIISEVCQYTAETMTAMHELVS